MCQESRDLSQKVEEHAEEVNLNTTQSREEKEEVQREIPEASPPRRRKRYHHFGSDDSETD